MPARGRQPVRDQRDFLKKGIPDRLRQLGLIKVNQIGTLTGTLGAMRWLTVQVTRRLRRTVRARPRIRRSQDIAVATNSVRSRPVRHRVRIMAVQPAARIERSSVTGYLRLYEDLPQVICDGRPARAAWYFPGGMRPGDLCRQIAVGQGSRGLPPYPWGRGFRRRFQNWKRRRPVSQGAAQASRLWWYPGRRLFVGLFDEELHARRFHRRPTTMLPSALMK